MKKRKAIVYTLIVMILGLFISFLFEIMPNEFQDSVTVFSKSIGLSYTLLWIICTLLVATVTLFFVWRQALTETDNNGQEKTSGITESQINQYGDKSFYIKKNKGDINVS